MFTQLANSPLFKGLSSDQITELLEQVNYHVRNYLEGQVLASREEECKSLLILIEGSVRGEMLDYSGKVLIVEDVVAPRPIAAAFLFGKNNQFPVDVIANNKVTVLTIPLHEVLKLFQLNAQFLKNYLNSISDRAQFLSQRIWFLSFKTIKGKLAQYILGLAKPDKTKVELPMSQQDLGEFFGVTRPSLARSLGELEKDGLIEVNRREIKIINRLELVQLLETS